MSVLNVNMPERDLDPEEIDLEQEEEDAFGKYLPSTNDEWGGMLTCRLLFQRFVDSNFNSYLDCQSSSFLQSSYDVFLEIWGLDC